MVNPLVTNATDLPAPKIKTPSGLDALGRTGPITVARGPDAQDLALTPRAVAVLRFAQSRR